MMPPLPSQFCTLFYHYVAFNNFCHIFHYLKYNHLTYCYIKIMNIRPRTYQDLDKNIHNCHYINHHPPCYYIQHPHPQHHGGKCSSPEQEKMQSQLVAQLMPFLKEKTLTLMFLTMFFKTQNIGQTMHLTMLIPHPYVCGYCFDIIFLNWPGPF